MYTIDQTEVNASCVLTGILKCYFDDLWPVAGVPVHVGAGIRFLGYHGHSLLQTCCALAHFYDMFKIIKIEPP